MVSLTPILTNTAANKLIELGKQIRACRKKLRISATVAAEAAGMSRVTLYRIEKGEPSVTVGAYFNAMIALNMDFGVAQTVLPADAMEVAHQGWIPVRIHLSDYPQLRQLAWQVQGSDELTPVEALSIYERNWRHVDVQALAPHEKQLVDALRAGLGDAVKNV